MKKLTTILAALAVLLLVQGCAGKNRAPRLVLLGEGTCQDTTTGQVWQGNKSATPLASLEETHAYIARLNQESTAKGWRLPTAAELYELNDLFDRHLNGQCLMDRKGHFWTGESSGEGMVGSFEPGATCDPGEQYIPRTGGGYVRAVRP